MNSVTSPDAANRECFARSALTRPIEVTAEDERELKDAMERYKQQSGRQFPTWSEILEVLRAMGYAKRIWKPVGPWSPVPPTSIGNDDTAGVVGWFATAESHVGP